MSKASDIARAKKESLFYPRKCSVPFAEVTNFGNLKVLRTDFEPHEALQFADWIKEMFGEPEQSAEEAVSEAMKKQGW